MTKDLTPPPNYFFYNVGLNKDNKIVSDIDSILQKKRLLSVDEFK